MSWHACGKATIGSLFYLLVKYEDVSVKQFNCKGDVGSQDVQAYGLYDGSGDYRTSPRRGISAESQGYITAIRTICLSQSHGDVATGYPVNANSKSDLPACSGQESDAG